MGRRNSSSLLAKCYYRGLTDSRVKWGDTTWMIGVLTALLQLLFSSVQVMCDNKALTLHAPDFMLPLWFWLQVRVLTSALLGRKSTCISLAHPWNLWEMSVVCGRSFWIFSFRTAPCCSPQFLHFSHCIEELQNLYRKRNHLRRGRKKMWLHKGILLGEQVWTNFCDFNLCI